MTPEQEDQVRRALADAAADAPPMPSEVVARMDDVVAELVAAREASGREPSGTAGATDDLAQRRRRRRRRAEVLVAAVLCLIALGGPAVLRTVTSGDDSSSRTETAAGGSSAQDATSPAPATDDGRSLAGEAALPPPELHRATLQRDARRIAVGAPAYVAPHATRTGPLPTNQGCDAPATRRGDVVIAVRLDGEPATLVLGAAARGARVARVYACDDASAPVATTQVRVP